MFSLYVRKRLVLLGWLLALAQGKGPVSQRHQEGRPAKPRKRTSGQATSFLDPAL